LTVADLARAHAGSLAPSAGGYESWFLRAASPDGRLAIWLRYTVHKPVGGAAVGSLWLTLFDAGSAHPVALKTTCAPHELEFPDAGEHVRIGGSAIGPGHAHGAIALDGVGSADWALAFSSDQHAAATLPYDALYRWAIPRAKPASIHPATTLSGTITVGQRSIDVGGWRGCVGHNWGSEHTHEWLWLQAADLGDETSWLDCAIGRMPVGPLLSPWIGGGWLCLDGVRHRLGTGRGVLHSRVSIGAAGARFVLANTQLTLSGQIDAPPESSVAWQYGNPDGTKRAVVHCSIARMRLELRDRSGPARTLTATGVGYEHGGGEAQAAVYAAPFTDP